ncbi:MAG: hypothetical protein ACXWL9_03445 [Syntrophales bacterium]
MPKNKTRAGTIIVPPPIPISPPRIPATSPSSIYEAASMTHAFVYS